MFDGMNKVFSFGIPVSGELFTDREEETKRLVSNFTHGINSFILSPRRWGKTSLVQKAISQTPSRGRMFVYLDVLHCKTQDDFCRAFAAAVLRQTAGRAEEILSWARDFLSHIFVGLELSPNPDNPFSITFDWRDAAHSEEDIFSLPEKIAVKKGVDIVVCIDEFQQIANYPDSLAFQAKLRGIWQLQQHTVYCLFGSRKHAMEGLFDGAEKPFYKFGDILYLKTIPLDYWIPFISGKFREAGKTISDEMCRTICETVAFNSSYVQQLSWYIFQMTERTADEQALNSAIDELVAQCSDVFDARTQDLTAYQMRYLKALADGITEGLSSSEVVSKYRLGSSANVAAIKTALLDKDIIDSKGASVTLADPVMGLWLKRL